MNEKQGKKPHKTHTHQFSEIWIDRMWPFDKHKRLLRDLLECKYSSRFYPSVATSHSSLAPSLPLHFYTVDLADPNSSIPKHWTHSSMENQTHQQEPQGPLRHNQESQASTNVQNSLFLSTFKSEVKHSLTNKQFFFWSSFIWLYDSNFRRL